MELQSVFGKVVKSIRIKKNISQEQLSQESTLDRSYISLLENGKYQPSLTSLFDIARALDMKPSALIRLIEIEFENQKS